MSHRDPRMLQVAVLASLLSYGTLVLGFGVSGPRIVLLLGLALATQYLATRLWRLPRYDPWSALISGLSLSLLLRTGDPRLAAAAAVVTIVGKFVIRVDDRHVFNPTNLGLVVMLLASDRVWVSPGQWGNVAFFGFLLASLGVVVVNRAARSDVTAAFAFGYAAIVLGRGWWLGDPPAVGLHHLQSGGLVLFTFFMISDPKTTPTSRAGRVLFALLVASVGAYAQFGRHEPHGLLWALAGCAPSVPLLNRWLPGPAYSWPGRASHSRRATPLDVSAAAAAP